jgi:hypothetical protein
VSRLVEERDGAASFGAVPAVHHVRPPTKLDPRERQEELTWLQERIDGERDAIAVLESHVDLRPYQPDYEEVARILVRIDASSDEPVQVNTLNRRVRRIEARLGRPPRPRRTEERRERADAEDQAP